jgi:hypothetical protein
MGELTAMSVNGHKPKFTRGEPVPQLATMRLSVTRVVSDFSIREDDPPPARPRVSTRRSTATATVKRTREEGARARIPAGVCRSEARTRAFYQGTLEAPVNVAAGTASSIGDGLYGALQARITPAALSKSILTARSTG